MKPLTTKQLTRIEKKKKKVAAFLEIAKLNDKDREIKAMHQRQSLISDYESLESKLGLNRDGGPSRKRQKKDDYEQSQFQGDSIYQSGSPHKYHWEASNSFTLSCSQNMTEQISFTEFQIDKKCYGVGDSAQTNTDDSEKLKKRIKERKMHIKPHPRFRLKAPGDSASINVHEDKRTPLFLSDIQHLILYSLLGHQSPYFPFRWCHIERWSKVTQTVVLLIEDVSLYDFQSCESLFNFISSHFSSRVEVIMPSAYNGNLVQELASVPVTATQRNELIKKYGSLEAALRQNEVFQVMRAMFPVTTEVSNKSEDISNQDTFPRTQLLLSAWQLVDENYPLPVKGELANKYSEYVLTKDKYDEVSANSPLFGLDCEMCLTKAGSELTRVSVVNEEYEVVYETFVLPDNPIIEYLTRYSGITEKDLEGVVVKLQDVQKDLQQLLPRDAILVGQSLNSDLHALKMMHPYCIDTSVIFNITGERRRKAKLRTLVQRFLGEDIQLGSHCSVEDSMACLKLTHLKLTKNLEFGDAVLAGSKKNVDVTNDRSQDSSLNVATSLFNQISRSQKTAVIISSPENNDAYLKYTSYGENEIGDIRCIPIMSNKEIIERACEESPNHSFVLAHVKIPFTDERLRVVKKINSWVERIWNAMAENGLFIISFGGQTGLANGASFIDFKRHKYVSSNL